MQKLLSLIRSHLFISAFVSLALGDRSKKKIIATIYIKECSAYLLFWEFYGFRSYFEFIFIYSMRRCSEFIPLHVAVHFSKNHLLKDCIFSIAYFFLLCHRLLLLSRFSRVRLCATPQTAAHQTPQSLGFSRQEHWSGLPFPSTLT